jgi:hypothetical protein
VPADTAHARKWSRLARRTYVVHTVPRGLDPFVCRTQVHYIYACIIMHVIGSPQGRGQISRACAESAARGQMSTCMHYGLSVPQHMHRSIHGWSSLSLLVLSTAGCEEASFAPPHCQPTDGRPCLSPCCIDYTGSLLRLRRFARTAAGWDYKRARSCAQLSCKKRIHQLRLQFELVSSSILV